MSQRTLALQAIIARNNGCLWEKNSPMSPGMMVLDANVSRDNVTGNNRPTNIDPNLGTDVSRDNGPRYICHKLTLEINISGNNGPWIKYLQEQWH